MPNCVQCGREFKNISFDDECHLCFYPGCPNQGLVRVPGLEKKKKKHSKQPQYPAGLGSKSFTKS